MCRWIALAFVAAALALSGPLTGPATAAPAATCPPANIWVNGNVGGRHSLQQYSPTGNLVSSTDLSAYYGDIAWSADGSQLWAITFEAAPASLVRLNPTTGAVLQTRPLTIPGPSTEPGMIYPVAYVTNSLSPYVDPVRGPGFLFGSLASTDVYFVPEQGAGTAVKWGSWPTASNGDRLTSAGDFLVLEDGTVLGLADSLDSAGNLLDGTEAVRFQANGSGPRVVGTLPTIYGAAKSGSDVVLALANGGKLVKLPQDAIPTTASDAPLQTTDLTTVSGAAWAGATSQQDATVCATPAPGYTVAKAVSAGRGSRVHPGQVLTYTITVRNTGNVAYTAQAPASFKDDLSRVVGHATLVGTPAASTGAAVVAGKTLTWSGPLTLHGTATIRYRVKVANRGKARRVLHNAVTATATGGACAGSGACVTNNPLPAAATRPRSTSTPTAPVQATTVPAAATSTTASLPDTGSDVSPWLIAVAAALLLAGTALLTRVRRRR